MMTDAREETKSFNREAKVKDVTLTTDDGMVHNIDTAIFQVDDELYLGSDHRLTVDGMNKEGITIDLAWEGPLPSDMEVLAVCAMPVGEDHIKRVCKYEGTDVQIRQVKDSYAPVAVFKRSGYNHIGLWREDGFYEAMGRAREMLMQVHAGKIRPIINNQR